jgi:pSer/pThr/pTyr-binding forkhead associated (FHA) protein
MKLSLVVMTPGKMEGKSIPVTLSQFLIGRDQQCQLRPASALISKRHCAVLIRGERAFVRDFDSTNGTSLNDQPVKGEAEIRNNDHLKLGPLDFRVVLETGVPAEKPVPARQAAPTGAAHDDEAAAALLLSVGDEPVPSPAVDSDGVPTGSTVMETFPQPGGEPAKDEAKSGGAEREKAAKAAQGNTSSAAKAILEKYMRRPRG